MDAFNAIQHRIAKFQIHRRDIAFQLVQRRRADNVGG